jgi:hypothetical protein
MQLPKRCFVVIQISGHWTRSTNPVILSVTHHCQNPFQDLSRFVPRSLSHYPLPLSFCALPHRGNLFPLQVLSLQRQLLLNKELQQVPGYLRLALGLESCHTGYSSCSVDVCLKVKQCPVSCHTSFHCMILSIMKPSMNGC